MRYHIDFSKKAEKVIKKWKKSNPVLFKKLHDLLPELEENTQKQEQDIQNHLLAKTPSHILAISVLTTESFMIFTGKRSLCLSLRLKGTTTTNSTD